MTSEAVKLHVKNLPVECSQQDVAQLFQQYAPVLDVRIIRKGANGLPLSGRDPALRAVSELTARGYSVSLSRDEQKKSLYDEVAVPASYGAVRENAVLTWMMIGKGVGDVGKAQELIQKNHPSAFHLQDLPPPYWQTLFSRELWVGNISPTTDKKLIFTEFKTFGSIECIEMFSSKGFAFVKFRRVLAASAAFERQRSITIDGRPIRATFSDPTRRFDTLGNSLHPLDPLFDPSSDLHFKTLYLGFSPTAVVPADALLAGVFGRYGRVRGVYVKRGRQPYAFVDFESGEEAAKALSEMYTNDKSGQKRAEIGDSRVEISFKNTNNARKTVQKSDVEELARKLVETPSIILNLDVKQAVSPQQWAAPGRQVWPGAAADTPTAKKGRTEEPGERAARDVVWSGFMSRASQSRVGIDAYLLAGSESLLPPSTHHLTITHRVAFPEIRRRGPPTALMALAASDPTQEGRFSEYVKYLREKQRAGVVTMRESVLFIVPSGEEADQFGTSVAPNELLAVFVDPSQKPQSPKPPLSALLQVVATHPALASQLLSNPL